MRLTAFLAWIATVSPVVLACDAVGTQSSAVVRSEPAALRDACDAVCEPGAGCCTERFVHGSGASVGWTRRGAAMFRVDDPDDAAAALTELKRWISEKPTRAGLSAAMPNIGPLAGLVAGHVPPRRHGALVVHHLAQTYRGLPVVGAGEHVTLTIAPGHGAVSVSGALVDARDVYPGWHASISPAEAITTAEMLLALDEGEVDGLPFSFGAPRLVAVAEVRALAWEIAVARAGHPRGTLLLRADDGAMVSFSPDSHFGPDDEVPVQVRARSFASDFYDLTNPTLQDVVDLTEAALTGGPLLGSSYTPLACDGNPNALQACGQIRLGNRQVIVLDAEDEDFYGDNTTHPRIAARPDGQFLATPPATAAEKTPMRTDAALQDFFYRLQAVYSLIDGYHAGKWDSWRGDSSGFPALEYKPRVVLAHNTDVALTCGQSQPGCAKHYLPFEFDDFDKVQVYDEHPEADLPGHIWAEGDPNTEVMGFIGTAVDGFTSPGLVFHEFGHIVDLFAVNGFIGHGISGSGCAGKGADEPCDAACVLDSTDEGEALAETVADLINLFAVGELYTNVPYDRCGAVAGIASPVAPVHDAACADHPTDIKSFLDQRPTEPGMYEEDGLWLPTGKCHDSPGYRQSAILQAFWEWTHARDCSPVAPYTCESFADEPEGARLGIEAVLYAMSQTNATYYRKLFADMETYIACTDGPTRASRFRAVFCHHGAMDCDALPPVCPATCGDGEAELAEACDGADLRGQTCFDRGFSGGDLACTPACTYDTSHCTSDPGGDPPSEPTTPTSGPDVPTLGEDSATVATGAASEDSADAMHGEDGCGCRHGAPFGGLLALLLLTPRRRRVDSAASARIR